MCCKDEGDERLTANHTDGIIDDVDTFALGDFCDFLLPILFGVVYGVVRASQSFADIELGVCACGGDDVCSEG